MVELDPAATLAEFPASPLHTDVWENPDLPLKPTVRGAVHGAFPPPPLRLEPIGTIPPAESRGTLLRPAGTTSLAA
jgi:hypothetical protein